MVDERQRFRLRTVGRWHLEPRKARESVLQSFREGTVHCWPAELRDVLHQVPIDLLQHPEEVCVLSFLPSCSVRLERSMSPFLVSSEQSK